MNTESRNARAHLRRPTQAARYRDEKRKALASNSSYPMTRSLRQTRIGLPGRPTVVHHALFAVDHPNMLPSADDNDSQQPVTGATILNP
jgi:hypothetical protein